MKGITIDRTGKRRKGKGGGTGSLITIYNGAAVRGDDLTRLIAHEIFHSYEIDKGILNTNRMAPIGDDPGRSDGKGVKISEYRAVQFENHVRANLGLPLQTYYDEGKAEGKRTGLLNENHNYKLSSGLENKIQ